MAGAADTAGPADAAPEQSPAQYLTRFWRSNASAFMRWFLALPYAGQVSLLRNASPDIPVSYDPKETRPQAAQLLTPELTLKALLEENGKVLLRLMNARATKADQCSRHDLLYLASLRANGTMPTFSGRRSSTCRWPSSTWRTRDTTCNRCCPRRRPRSSRRRRT